MLARVFRLERFIGGCAPRTKPLRTGQHFDLQLQRHSTLAMEKEEVQHQELRSYSVDTSGRRLSVLGRRVSVVDDVFGEIVEGGPNYRNVGLSQGSISQKLTTFTRSAGWALALL